MSRKSTRITISEEGRDKNKVFVLTELPADQGERWFIRALQAAAQSGADISDEVIAGGAASFAMLGLQILSGVPWATLEPLLEEMWECVQYQHAPNIPLQSITVGINSQIEEITTRIKLRRAVFNLHAGFFIAEASPTSAPASGESEGSTAPTFLESLVSWCRRG